MIIANSLLVQFYEHAIVEKYWDSVERALENLPDDVQVIQDIYINLDQRLEKCNVDIGEIREKIYENLNGRGLKFRNSIVKIADITGEESNFPYNIGEYRRDFNRYYSEQADVLVWGESDSLVPSQFFRYIAELHDSLQGTPYTAFFADRVLWDESWNPLVFNKFEGLPFIEGDKVNSWSFHYNMGFEEMERLNEDNQKIVKCILPQFNGCNLILSSEVIKQGINIPESMFFMFEDTALLHECRRERIPHYVFKDVLLVHNRKAPDKRLNVAGEEDVDDTTKIGKMRDRHEWYRLAQKYSNENLQNLGNPNYSPKGWKDVLGAGL